MCATIYMLMYIVNLLMQSFIFFFVLYIFSTVYVFSIFIAFYKSIIYNIQNFYFSFPLPQTSFILKESAWLAS